VVGNPAKVKRDLTEADHKELIRIRQSYVDKGKTYRQLEKEPLERK
jgi:carbonic anhydrase/acetyltransferase-like protein (isoleucine patch superfamily)